MSERFVTLPNKINLLLMMAKSKTRSLANDADRGLERRSRERHRAVNFLSCRFAVRTDDRTLRLGFLWRLGLFGV